MKAKKIAKMLAAAMLAGAVTVSPIAAMEQITITDPPGIELLWDNAYTEEVDFNITNNKLYISIYIPGKSGTTFTNGTITLEKVGSQGGVVREWTNLSSTSNTFTFTNNTYTPIKGGYTLSYRITAVRNGVSEVIYGSKSLTYGG